MNSSLLGTHRGAARSPWLAIAFGVISTLGGGHAGAIEQHGPGLGPTTTGSATCPFCPWDGNTSRSRRDSVPRAPQQRHARGMGMERFWAVQRARSPRWIDICGNGDGEAHTVARRSDGSVVAWGYNWDEGMQRSRASGRSDVRRRVRGQFSLLGAPQRRHRRGVGIQL